MGNRITIGRSRSAAMAFFGGLLTAVLAGCSQQTDLPASVAQAAPSQTVSAQAAPGPEPAPDVPVTSCDGQKTVTVAADLTGRDLADALMDQWKRDHPGRDWVAEEKSRHAMKPPADNSDLLKGDQRKGHPYGNFTQRDLENWARETEKFVAEGSRVFHDAKALGGTVGVSCDMCHPHAANTHPETYPKFQTQLGRVALLRDMIDWCIEHPVRGKHLGSDDPRMRALEAYIMAQRSGVKMGYGKH